MPSRSSDAQIVATLIACGLSMAAVGCARQKVQAAPPVTAVPANTTAETQRPMTIAPDTNASPPPETVAPPPAIPDSTTPPTVTAPHPKPARPPRPASEPATEPPPDQPAHQPAPQISPQLTPEQQANYERKTNEDIAVAEKNLQIASGRQTSAAQDDLKEKIRRFIEQSRDAVKVGDLARAQNLAQKARLLSIELVESL